MTVRQLNPAYIEGVKNVLKSAPFFELLSMEMEDLAPGRAVFVIPAQDKHMNPFKRVHGGVFASVMDAATFWAVYSQVDAENPMTTTELKVNYLGPSGPGRILRAVGQVVKTGRSLGVAEARLEEAETGRLVGFASATCMILPPPLPPELAALPEKYLSD